MILDQSQPSLIKFQFAKISNYLFIIDDSAKTVSTSLSKKNPLHFPTQCTLITQLLNYNFDSTDIYIYNAVAVNYGDCILD